MERLETAAISHGYELWSRVGIAHLEVLALPTTLTPGTPEALIDSFKELGQGLPLPPSRARLARLRDQKSVRLSKRNEAGQVSYFIDGAPPFELVFKTDVPRAT